MGLIDDLLPIATGGSTQQAEHSSALGAILNYINSAPVGGLAGLQSMFQQGGLGHIVSSWIGTGQNLPISADQLQSVLHSGALQQVAQQAGMDPSRLTGLMSTLLPNLVDKLTPNGQLPEAGSLQQMLKSFTANG